MLTLTFIFDFFKGQFYKENFQSSLYKVEPHNLLKILETYFILACRKSPQNGKNFKCYSQGWSWKKLNSLDSSLWMSALLQIFSEDTDKIDVHFFWAGIGIDNICALRVRIYKILLNK